MVREVRRGFSPRAGAMRWESPINWESTVTGAGRNCSSPSKISILFRFILFFSYELVTFWTHFMGIVYSR